MIALDLFQLAWGFFLLGLGIFIAIICWLAIAETKRAKKQLEDADSDEGWRW